MSTPLTKYDPRTRLRILWGGAAVLLLLCYTLAIRPTLRLRSEYRILQAGEASRQANLRELERLRAGAGGRGGLFATLAGTGRGGEPAVSEPERIAQLAQGYGVTVRQLPAPEVLGTETLQLYYTQYRLEGSFSGLVRLVGDVEAWEGIHLLSATFIKQPNPATRLPELLLQLRTVRRADKQNDD